MAQRKQTVSVVTFFEDGREHSEEQPLLNLVVTYLGVVHRIRCTKEDFGGCIQRLTQKPRQNLDVFLDSEELTSPLKDADLQDGMRVEVFVRSKKKKVELADIRRKVRNKTPLSRVEIKYLNTVKKYYDASKNIRWKDIIVNLGENLYSLSAEELKYFEQKTAKFADIDYELTEPPAYQESDNTQTIYKYGQPSTSKGLGTCKVLFSNEALENPSEDKESSEIDLEREQKKMSSSSESGNSEAKRDDEDVIEETSSQEKDDEDIKEETPSQEKQSEFQARGRTSFRQGLSRKRARPSVITSRRLKIQELKTGSSAQDQPKEKNRYSAMCTKYPVEVTLFSTGGKPSDRDLQRYYEELEELEDGASSPKRMKEDFGNEEAATSYELSENDLKRIKEISVTENPEIKSLKENVVIEEATSNGASAEPDSKRDDNDSEDEVTLEKIDGDLIIQEEPENCESSANDLEKSENIGSPISDRENSDEEREYERPDDEILFQRSADETISGIILEVDYNF